MSVCPFENMSTAQILKTHIELMEELRRRDILRSANNPTGDLAEYLFCQAFGWKQAKNSQSGYDAFDEKGVRYQIKGRRIHARNSSRQLSALRNLSDQPFDILAAVLFDDEYKITRAACIPHETVLRNSRYRAHTNSHLFHLRDAVWADETVRDVTQDLQSVLLS